MLQMGYQYTNVKNAFFLFVKLIREDLYNL